MTLFMTSAPGLCGREVTCLTNIKVHSNEVGRHFKIFDFCKGRLDKLLCPFQQNLQQSVQKEQAS